MSELLRRFKREAKTGAARGQPARKHALGRQLVEGIVHFDGVQLSCVVFQELLLRKRLRIESRFPARICPTGGTNEGSVP